ncbi:MAG: aromatic ring-hydroxylating oxygenase subunit alpha [Sporichthyaceae bacterium]
MTTVGTRASCWLSERELIARVLAHVDAGTTDLGPSTGRVPVSHYLDPERYAAELRMLRSTAVPFCASAELERGGSYLARTAAGVPLLAVRDRAGVVHAFRNSCGHRGTTLVEGVGCARALVCPFHGWVYALDGSVSHVPHPEGFPGIDFTERGLVPVACRERNGLVWIDQDGPGTFDGVGDLPGVTEHQAVVGRQLIAVAVNWKILVEGFLEGYHIRATHPATFLPYGYDNLTVVEHHGPHSRVTFPFRRVEELRDQPPEAWHAEGTTTNVQHLFPNVVLAHLTAHTAFIAVEPVTVDSSLLSITQLAAPAADGSVPKAVARDIEFVAQGLAEDRAMAVIVQRGVQARGGDVVFARYESALTHFHAGLAQRI